MKIADTLFTRQWRYSESQRRNAEKRWSYIRLVGAPERITSHQVNQTLKLSNHAKVASEFVRETRRLPDQIFYSSTTFVQWICASLLPSTTAKLPIVFVSRSNALKIFFQKYFDADIFLWSQRFSLIASCTQNTQGTAHHVAGVLGNHCIKFVQL